MRNAFFLLNAICAVVLAGSMHGQQPMPSMPGPVHHHHDDALPPAERLGLVSFPTSCAARSQAAIERGVALLHSFGYVEAQMQFAAIAKSDPACAMAHWGIAMTQYQELWDQPDQRPSSLAPTRWQRRALCLRRQPRSRRARRHTSLRLALSSIGRT